MRHLPHLAGLPGATSMAGWAVVRQFRLL